MAKNEEIIPLSQYSAPEQEIIPLSEYAPKEKGILEGISSSIKRKAGQTQTAVGRALQDVGIAAGADIADAGRRRADENQAEVNSLEDAANKPGATIVQGVGETPVDMGVNLVGRGIGGALGGLASAVPVLRPFRKQLIGAGEEAGGFVASGIQSYGGIREDQDANEVDDKGAALAAAAGSALLETALGPERLIAGILHGKSGLASGGSRVLNAAKRGAEGMLAEGVIEYPQSMIEQVGAGSDPLTEAGQKQALFEGLMGTVGGGVVGSAVGAVEPRQEPRAPRNAEEVLRSLANGEIPDANIDDMLPGAAQNEGMAPSPDAGPVERIVAQAPVLPEPAAQTVDESGAPAAPAAAAGEGIIEQPAPAAPAADPGERTAPGPIAGQPAVQPGPPQNAAQVQSALGFVPDPARGPLSRAVDTAVKTGVIAGAAPAEIPQEQRYVPPAPAVAAPAPQPQLVQPAETPQSLRQRTVYDAAQRQADAAEQQRADAAPKSAASRVEKPQFEERVSPTGRPYKTQLAANAAARMQKNEGFTPFRKSNSEWVLRKEISQLPPSASRFDNANSSDASARFSNRPSEVRAGADSSAVLGQKPTSERVSAPVSEASSQRPVDTVDVDGEALPRTNSNGKPIAQDDDSVRNFWRTMKGTKVADAADTAHDSYAVFDPAQIKSSTGNVGTFGARAPNAQESASVGMTEKQAASAQKKGDIRFSQKPAEAEPKWQRTDDNLLPEEAEIRANYLKNGSVIGRRGERKGAWDGYEIRVVPADVKGRFAVEARKLPARQSANAAGWHDRPVREGSTSIVGVHYANKAGLTELDGKFYGTNHAGAESKRLALLKGEKRKALFNRVHFYPEGSELSKNGESVVGRAAVHRVKLDNIYDIGADPLKLVDKVDKGGSMSTADFMNALEWEIIKRGFDGYHSPKMQMVAVLGAKPIPVGKAESADGKWSNAPAPAAPAAAGSERTKMLRDLYAPITSKWGIGVEVVDSPNDFPDAVKASPDFNPALSEAVLFGDKIYVASNMVSTIRDAYRLLAHEGVAHVGVERSMGEKWPSVREALLKLADTEGWINEAVSMRYPRATDDVRASETLAIIAESGHNSTALSRAIAAVRQFLRSVGFKIEMTEKDIREILADAARNMDRGKDGATRFSSASSVVTVDGVERPAMNSNGGRIHQTDDGVRNFWKWFGNSRAVDEQGRPIVVYHGTTNGGFDRFETNRESKVDSAFFFTPNARMAATYSGTLSEVSGDELGDDLGLRRLYPSYLKITSDMEVSFGDANWDGTGAEPTYNLLDESGDIIDNVDSIEEAEDAVDDGSADSYEEVSEIFTTTDDEVREAMRQGKDGIIIRDVIDDGPEGRNYEPSDVYVVFKPNQIKSAELNSGEFSAADSRIQFSNIAGYDVEEIDPSSLDFTGYAGLSDAERQSQAIASRAAALYKMLGTGSPFFRKWFDGSKMRKENGQPIKLYHATNANFESFDLGRRGESTGYAASGLGIFLNPKRARVERYGDNVLALYASIKKPYRMSAAESSSFETVDDAARRRAELARQGYDGIIIKEDLTVIAFYPSQVKSVDNAGTFDGEKIRFSQRQYKMDIEREERTKKKFAGISQAERASVVAQAKELGLTKKQTEQILSTARAQKKAFPASAGWANIELVGIDVKRDEEDQIIGLDPSFRAIAYAYNVPPGKDRAPPKIDEKWARKVADKFRSLVEDIYARAEKGDKNAQVIIGHQTWYRNVAEILRREYGANGDLLSDLLGATSPNTPVDMNWRFSVEIMRRFMNGDFNRELKAFDEYVAAGNAMKDFPRIDRIKQVSGKLYGMNSVNAAKALLDVWRVIEPGSAPKARNFALNLIGQSNMATIDVWAARMLRRAAGMLPGVNLPRIPPPAEKGVTGKWNASATGVTGEFGFGAEVMELVSKDLVKKGRNVTPPDLQAIAWFAEKELWGQKGWTTKTGEGGSFEENIEAMPTERYLAGWSIQQGEKVPEISAASDAQKRVTRVLLDDDSVVAARVMPTYGLYGGSVEESFDTEWTANRGKHDPSAVMAEIAKLAQENKQYDIFVSRALRPDEASENARPGVEIFFRDKRSIDAAMPILEAFTSKGQDGFTMAVDPRAKSQGKPGDQFIGVRLQYVPEISMRWDDGLRESLKKAPASISKIIAEKAALLAEVAEKVSRIDGVAYAAPQLYDTVVVGKENYGDYIGRIAGATNQKNGNSPWFGEPVREAVERAAARIESERQRLGAGGVPDASGAAGSQFSNRADPFYSALVRSVTGGTMPKKASAAAYKQWLDGAQRRGEFKQAERDWIGVDAWLDSQGEVTKQQLADFVRANQVQVQETVLGRDNRAWLTSERNAGRVSSKFDEYQLPGGKNYRELLLTLPKAQGKYEYKSGHWDQPNILTHVRFNERTDADGKRVLFVEEVQSDWHQDGRKQGYAEGNKEQTVYIVEHWGDGRLSSTSQFQTKEAAEKRAEEYRNNPARSLGDHRWEVVPKTVRADESGKVPDAPLKKEWPLAAMKRMIRWAAENGFDKIAWTTGAQQADRYGLSKQLDSISVPSVNSDGSRSVRIDVADDLSSSFKLTVDTGGKVSGYGRASQFSGKQLDDLIGKDAAGKVMAAEAGASFSGDDLKLGGEGMRAFYDKMLPNELGKYVKKWGAKVGEAKIVVPIPANEEGSDYYIYANGGDTWAVESKKTGEYKVFATEGEAHAYANGQSKQTAPQPAIEITPAMRESALEGQPLFSNKPTIEQRLQDYMQTSKTFNWWHRSVGTQYHKAQVDDDFRPVFEQGQAFLNDISRIATETAGRAPNLLPRLEGLRDILKRGPNKVDRERVSSAIFNGTLNDQRVYADSELRARFKMNDKQIGLYREARAAIDSSLEELHAADVASLVRSDVSSQVIEQMRKSPARAGQIAIAELQKLLPQKPKIQETIDEIQTRSDKILQLQGEGYAPLMRFGKYAVYVVDKTTGDQIYFGTFERESDANRMARDMKELYPKAKHQQGVMAQDSYQMFKGLSIDTLELFAEKTGMSASRAVQDFLRLAKNNRSALKRLIRRKGVAGFDDDVSRVLSSFITSNARAASTNYNMSDMAKSVARIPKEKGDVVDESVRLMQYLQNPQEEAAGLRNMLFIQFLGGSIASAALNMTQPVTMTMPWLSQYAGTSRAAAALAAATKIAVTGKTTDPKLAAAIKRATEEGIVAPHEIHQLYAESIRNFGSHPVIRKALTVWGSLFSLGEAFNRRMTFAAAYQLADKTPSIVSKGGFRDAYDFATNAVEATQGIYNKGNRPNWARGTIGATVFTFKQYSISYLEFLKRLPRKEKALALAVLVLASGLQGLPGADDLEDLIDTLSQSLGYNSNSKRELREALMAALGEDWGQYVTHGFSAGTPFDVQQRMGLGNLIPGTAILQKSNQNKTREVTEVLGPIGGLIQQVMDAYGNAQEGNFGRAAMDLAPLAVKNVAKGVEMATTGAYNDKLGRKVTEASDSESALKAVGFQPRRVAEVQRNVGELQQQVDLARVTEGEIADQWAKAIAAGDERAKADAVQKLQRWNRQNPKWPIRISPQQLKQRVRMLQMSKEERFLKAAPRELRSTLMQ